MPIKAITRKRLKWFQSRMLTWVALGLLAWVGGADLPIRAESEREGQSSSQVAHRRRNIAPIELFPSNANGSCHEEFETIANRLQPGDELILHGGQYTQTCRRVITVNGTAAHPIIIRAADGELPILTRPKPVNYHYPQNNIEIENSSYLIIRGLLFKGGSIGVRFIGGRHITFEDNEISETSNNAIALNRGDTHGFIIRHNHIHHTGLLDRAVGATEGEGMYIGCNQARCIASNHLIENNYIHHLRSTSDGGNDGIEIKVGSFGNTVRDNVIHDTIIGTRYPCIFVYGGGSSPNIVEGNVLWNCGEAIQVVADAIVRNNLILNSDVGITAAPHVQVAHIKNVAIVNNTLHGHSECLNIDWSSATTMILANNAVYCPGNTAVNIKGLDRASIHISSNYVKGNQLKARIDNRQFFDGGNAASIFNNPSSLDFWPRAGSLLSGTANPTYVPNVDFNGNLRTSPYDVGAYEREGQATNPGWPISKGFKEPSTVQ